MKKLNLSAILYILILTLIGVGSIGSAIIFWFWRSLDILFLEPEPDRGELLFLTLLGMVLLVTGGIALLGAWVMVEDLIKGKTEDDS